MSQQIEASGIWMELKAWFPSNAAPTVIASTLRSGFCVARVAQAINPSKNLKCFEFNFVFNYV